MRVFRGSRLVVLIVALLLAAGGVWWTQRKPAANALEQWCASQLRRIADDLLVPRLDFGSLRLELPVTVTLDDVSLTSDGTAFIRMSSMRLEFRERPRRGQPLVIEAATFVDPEVRLIQGANGGLLGFGEFVRPTEGERYEDGGSSRPSDLLAIRRIAIRDGMLEWAPAGYEHPMVLDHLEIDLATSPDADRRGWYAFRAGIALPPVVQLDWDGGISIDTGDLAFDDTTLRVDLSEDEYARLTPSIQDVLRQYSIVGQLTLRATGHVPLAAAEGTDLAFDVALRDAGAAFGDYHFPVESAAMKATFRQMRLACDPLSVTAFGGQIGVTWDHGFDDARAFSVSATARDVRLQDMLRPTPGRDEPKLAGRIGLQLEAAGSGSEPDRTVNGTGTLTIEEGSLINIPLIGAMAKALNATGHAESRRDRGEVVFTVGSDRATIDRALIESPTAAARGTGDIHYDGRLDLKVNAGVIEKAESVLGPLGHVLGAMTDHLLPFKVSGTWSEPVVTPAPLGFGLGAESEPDR